MHTERDLDAPFVIDPSSLRLIAVRINKNTATMHIVAIKLALKAVLVCVCVLAESALDAVLPLAIVSIAIRVRKSAAPMLQIVSPLAIVRAACRRIEWQKLQSAK